MCSPVEFSISKHILPLSDACPSDRCGLILFFIYTSLTRVRKNSVSDLTCPTFLHCQVKPDIEARLNRAVKIGGCLIVNKGPRQEED